MAESKTILKGSICLTDIPKEQMKKVICKDGKTRIYLNIAVFARKNPQVFTNNGVERTYTHFISCAPKQDERVDGVNYIIGDLETLSFGIQTPSVADIEASPAVSDDDDLPF